MGGNEGGGRGSDRWNLFGVRPTVQKSPTDPGSDSNTSGEKRPADEPLTFILFVLAGKLLGFSLQSYFGLHKSTTLDGIKTQVNLAVEDPANFKAPKLEVTVAEEKKASAHKLKHRDMNILTPSGF
ncbi:putative monooxygenase p33MONOX isoform X1 [Tachysurus fulvidraco]|uniref:putative monooxygenase p33MONOX isoform X1 n=1 Tax=Tachysurus fulvidraco TaxID=1234273 RepID=UPI000F50BEB4|nr:putative monooxygenase p33MONOX isoform X1 [Tachysurus fulvidraco]XP_027007835.1 putative monooxygenase p33MONOX isoform X1 [Tachysurus fulvidraco]